LTLINFRCTLAAWADPKAARMAYVVCSMTHAKFAGKFARLNLGIRTSFVSVAVFVVVGGNESFFGNNNQEPANIVVHSSWQDRPTLAFTAHGSAQAKNMARRSLSQ
jgi:hypothetical protein